MTPSQQSRTRARHARPVLLLGAALLALLPGCATSGTPRAETGDPAPPPVVARPAPAAPDTADEPLGTPVVPEPEPQPEPAPAALTVAEPPLTGAPTPLRRGALLPRRRIVAFYGNPASTRMGILGELPPERMLEKLDQEVAAWERADPGTPVQPALHLIATMAAGDPGDDGKYRVRMPASRIDQVLEWARSRDGILFLDIQPGRSRVQDELPRLRRWLVQPDVHLALDPEWNMGAQGVPGRTIGSMSAAEINHAIRWLADLVEEHDLPPKVLIVHRFTAGMVRGAADVLRDPRVQVVLHMDGWGPPRLKQDTFRAVVGPAATQFTGFKLFYRNDTRGGSRLLRPDEILGLRPVPFYIQYQ